MTDVMTLYSQTVWFWAQSDSHTNCPEHLSGSSVPSMFDKDPGWMKICPKCKALLLGQTRAHDTLDLTLQETF